MNYSVWVTAHLTRDSEVMLRNFLVNELGFPKDKIKNDLHATVYHARRPLLGLQDAREPIRFSVPGAELRMMAMAPGGENRRDDIDPQNCMIGLRIRRANGAAAPLEALRERFYAFETKRTLGVRAPSNSRRSAFGARHFQPHVTILKAGAVNDPDLSKLGILVRERISHIDFDRLIIRCRAR